MREVPIAAFAAAHADGAFVLDVREPGEYEAGHIPGVTLIPADQVPARLRELPRGGPVYVVCATGNRSLTVAAHLATAGFDARAVAGGTADWEQSGRPLVRGTRANVA
ncbi:MAG TPA: rhodanese-like domain-containing protein [Nocardioidaceae bacterium]|nr:rhodanese-like domain-containing protein [Nocardioidaceae bacterium]